MGSCRDCEVYCGDGWRLQYHRVRVELARVHCTPECRPFLVSSCIAFLLHNLMARRRYGMQYHGQMALQIGVLIAFTQLIPEHQVQVFGVLKARVKVCRAQPLKTRTRLSRSCISDLAYGLCHFLDRHEHHRLPMPIHRHPVRLPSLLDLASLLQEEHWGGYGWWGLVW